jgi:hypothetical protein
MATPTPPRYSHDGARFTRGGHEWEVVSFVDGKGRKHRFCREVGVRRSQSRGNVVQFRRSDGSLVQFKAKA